MSPRQLNNWAIYRLSKFKRKDKRGKVYVHNCYHLFLILSGKKSDGRFYISCKSCMKYNLTCWRKKSFTTSRITFHVYIFEKWISKEISDSFKFMVLDDSFSQFLSVVFYPGQELYWGRGWWRAAGTKTSTLMSEQWHLLLWSGRKASCILYWQFYKGRINIWALSVFEFMETLANISLNASTKLSRSNQSIVSNYEYITYQ